MGAAGDTFAPEAPKLCSRCPRLVEFREGNQRKHPDWFNGAVPSFGDLGARLLIVGLAPGLNGANRTGRPFTGDYAGDLLYSTLLQFGFARGRYDARADDGFELVDCIISNSVRCVPPQNKPTPQEINTCCGFLRSRMTALPNVRIMVALGGDLHVDLVCAAHRVVHRVPVTRDLRQGTGRGQGGFLESRIHALNLGQALLEAAHLLRELAQLLGDHLVVIHARHDPAAANRSSTRTDPVVGFYLSAGRKDAELSLLAARFSLRRSLSVRCGFFFCCFFGLSELLATTTSGPAAPLEAGS